MASWPAKGPPGRSRALTPARRAGQPLKRSLKIKFRLFIARGRGRALRRLLLLQHKSCACCRTRTAWWCCQTKHRCDRIAAPIRVASPGSPGCRRCCLLRHAAPLTASIRFGYVLNSQRIRDKRKVRGRKAKLKVMSDQVTKLQSVKAAAAAAAAAGGEHAAADGVVNLP